MKTISRCALGFTIMACANLALCQRLIAIDSGRSVYEVDMGTGVKTLLGTCSSNVGTSAGLAYDYDKNILYLTSTGNDSLYTLDLDTMTATLVGSYGDSAIVMHGLEYDGISEKLYGMSSHNSGLYEIDRSTGVATLIGTAGLTSFCNLGFDLNSNKMYMTNSGADSFYSVNLSTGASTLIGPLGGPVNPNSLAYDYFNDRLFMADNNTDSLYTVNRATGTASLVGSMGSGNVLGLAFVRQSSQIPILSFIVLEGTHFGGQLQSLVHSDDDRLYILNDEATQNALLQLELETGVPGQLMTVRVESSSSRSDLSLFVKFYHEGFDRFDNVAFGVGSLQDKVLKFVLPVGHPYTMGDGKIKMQLAWIPQADLEAADGWTESVDQIWLNEL